MAIEYQIGINCSKSEFSLFDFFQVINLAEKGIVSVHEIETHEVFPFEQRVDVKLDKFLENADEMLIGTVSVYSAVSELCSRVKCDLSLFFNYDYDIEYVKRESGDLSFPADETWVRKNIIELYDFFKQT